MKKLFYIFLTRPVTAVMLFFSITVVGLVSISNLPVELLPHTEFPKLNVSISWRGVSPETMEARVTAPTEAELAGINGVKKISSRTTEGNCRISLEFHPNTDMDYARIEISEKLSALKKELPYGVSQPRLSEYVPDDFKDLQGFITYTISADDSPGKIRKYAEDNLLYPLMSVDGVADVTIRGGTSREIKVVIDYNKAHSFGIANFEIAEAVKNSELILSAGVIRKGNTQYLLTIDNDVSNTRIIEEQVVKTLSDGTEIRLKDIGNVVDDYKEPESYYRINGKETISIIINKEPGKNTLDAAEAVVTKVKELSQNLPAGYDLNKEVDKSQHIVKDLNELYSGAVYSLIIISVVLLVIFRSTRYTLVILTSIFFSLLFSFILFYVFEITLNILTISAFIVGFGFMVDNSIVVIDFIDKNYDGRGIKRLTVVLKNIFFPVFASTLTTVSVFLPLLFLTGELRVYFEQFALGIVSTLFASLIVSFAVIPLLHLKMNPGKHRINKVSPRDQRYYGTILNKIIKHPKTATALAILVIGLPVWMLPERIETPVIKHLYNPVFDTEVYYDMSPYTEYALGGALNLFFNHVNRGEMWQYGKATSIGVRMELPNGNEISRINGLTKEFEREILAYKDRIKVLTANVYNEELARLRIEFTEKQSKTAFPYMLKNYLIAYATRLGGLEVSVWGYGPGFHSGGGSTSSFSVLAKGFNYVKVKELAEEFKGIIQGNPRVDNVDINKSGSFRAEDTYEITGVVDRQDLLRADIPIDFLFNSIAKTTRGNISYNKFRIKNEEVNYNIKFDNYKKLQLDKLNNMVITAPGGEKLKIKDVVDFKRRKVQTAIEREDQQYIRVIAFDYKGPYKYGNKLVESSISQVNVPEGYSIDKRQFRFRFGDEEEIQVWIILLMALILIFMVTSSLFESLKKPSIVLIAIPFAIVGTIFLFYLTDGTIDRGAYAGILLLIGLSVNNSIVLVDYLSNHLNTISLEKLIELSYKRLRPIFTTTLTTIGALIPLYLGSAASFWKSLSMSVMGGLMISSLFVVLFVPFIYWKITLWNYKKAGNLRSRLNASAN